MLHGAPLVSIIISESGRAPSADPSPLAQGPLLDWGQVRKGGREKEKEVGVGGEREREREREGEGGWCSGREREREGERERERELLDTRSLTPLLIQGEHKHDSA